MPKRKSIPIEAINLAARSGFLSKGLFKEFLMKGRPKSSLNRNWKGLLDSGYFVKHSDIRLDDIYLLNKQNKELENDLNHLMVPPPYTGVIRHDEIVLRGVLMIEDHGFLDNWKVESEFRKANQEALQFGMTEQSPKYPDAILQFKSSINPINVAVEIELTLKDRSRYHRILNTYSFRTDLDLVLYVCADKTIERAVEESALKHFYPSAAAEIGFMSKEDWTKDPVLADVRIQNSTCSLGSWIEKIEKDRISESE